MYSGAKKLSCVIAIDPEPFFAGSKDRSSGGRRRSKSGALWRLRQDEDLTDRQVHDAIKKWEMLERIVREVNPTEQVRSLARALPQQYQLRTLDAFQLAAALAC